MCQRPSVVGVPEPLQEEIGETQVDEVPSSLLTTPTPCHRVAYPEGSRVSGGVGVGVESGSPYSSDG